MKSRCVFFRAHGTFWSVYHVWVLSGRRLLLFPACFYKDENNPKISMAILFSFLFHTLFFWNKFFFNWNELINTVESTIEPNYPLTLLTNKVSDKKWTVTPFNKEKRGSWLSVIFRRDTLKLSFFRIKSACYWNKKSCFQKRQQEIQLNVDI